ncbi:MAG: XTP/dITP diphosphatase [Lachnospiraceae bacterium]|nr:XTP/dITP diphosphatase [Lachnospiraceae bacterium]
MIRVIFATGNRDKLREIREILDPREFEIVSMKEAGYDIDIEETGTTFAENALIKARAIAKASGCLTLADDSGLEIDAMDKQPGIYSARFLGHDTDYDYKNNYILERLKDVPEEKRTARYACAVAAARPDGREETVTEYFEGRIGYEQKGTNGFGYDPIFYVPEYGKYAAEMTPEEKNAVSHRGKALRAMKKILEEKMI